MSLRRFAFHPPLSAYDNTILTPALVPDDLLPAALCTTVGHTLCDKHYKPQVKSMQRCGKKSSTTTKNQFLGTWRAVNATCSPVSHWVSLTFKQRSPPPIYTSRYSNNIVSVQTCVPDLKAYLMQINMKSADTNCHLHKFHISAGQTQPPTQYIWADYRENKVTITFNVSLDWI